MLVNRKVEKERLNVWMDCAIENVDKRELMLTRLDLGQLAYFTCNMIKITLAND